MRAGCKRILLLMLGCALALGIPVRLSRAAEPGLILGPVVNRCAESADTGMDLAARIHTCQASLASSGLSDDEKSFLHGVLGSLFFERAISRLGREVTYERLLRANWTVEGRQDLNVSIERYSAALRIAPKSPMTYFNFWNRGYNKEILGDLKGALGDYDQVVRLKPDYIDGYVYRARVLARLGKRDQARADLDTALRLSPYDPKVLNAMKAFSSGPPQRK